MLTLILKGTNGCNLNCAYCSLGEKTRHDTVTQEMLPRIFEYACHICELRNESQLEIILHGGEPTLVPIKIYETAIKYAKKRFPKLKIGLSMQTNAFCISDDYLKFLLQYDVNVGVSIDGSAKIHNNERKSKNGKDTYDTVTRNINRMLDSGINVSGLMVLTSLGVIAPLDYLEYFASRHIHLKINPLLNYGEVYKNPELSLKQGDYAHYLIRVYEYIMEKDIDVTVSPIDKIFLAILQKDAIRECTFNAECNSNFICIDYNGDIFPCGKYSDIHGFKLGNVLSLHQDVLQRSEMELLKKRRSCCLPNECQRCKYVEMCHAGCNAEASIEGEFNEPPFLCKDYQILFDYFKGEGLLLLRRKLAERKQFIMERIDGV